MIHICVIQPQWVIERSTWSEYHYSDVIMGAMASQITSLTILYWTVYSGTDQRKHQSSESLAFVRGIHRWLVNSLHKWLVTRKMFPFDDVIMTHSNMHAYSWSIHCINWNASIKLCFVPIMSVTGLKYFSDFKAQWWPNQTGYMCHPVPKWFEAVMTPTCCGLFSHTLGIIK